MTVTVYGNLDVVESTFDGVLTDAQVARGDHGARTVFRSPNKIVDFGMQVFSRMLGGVTADATVGGVAFADLHDITVTQMVLGDSDMSGVTEIADAAVTSVGRVVSAPRLVVAYPTATSVRFSVVVASSEAVGKVITEEALHLANGIVFAKIIIRPGQTKLVPNIMR